MEKKPLNLDLKKSESILNNNDYFREINSHRLYHLIELKEAEGNSLKISIEPSFFHDSDDKSKKYKGKVEEGDLYELYFDCYIGYSVIDESFALPCDGEVFEGEFFRVYERSDYINYMNKVAFADDEHPGPGPIKHYGLNCLNHIIDVLSPVEPTITKTKWTSS